MTNIMPTSRLVARRRRTRSDRANMIHELVRVYDNGTEEVLNTRRSAHAYSYCVIKRNHYGGRTYSWSRNPGNGNQTTIPVR